MSERRPIGFVLAWSFVPSSKHTHLHPGWTISSLASRRFVFTCAGWRLAGLVARALPSVTLGQWSHRTLMLKHSSQRMFLLAAGLARR